MSERKRRKWDVAAPQGIPLHGNRAGIGMSGTSIASASAAGGLITAQGLQTAPSSVQQVPPPQAIPSPGAAAKPAQPIDRDTIARAQLGAAAIVAKLNQVRFRCTDRRVSCSRFAGMKMASADLHVFSFSESHLVQKQSRQRLSCPFLLGMHFKARECLSVSQHLPAGARSAGQAASRQGDVLCQAWGGRRHHHPGRLHQ